MEYIHRAQAFLESFHPATPWVLLTVACWVAVYSVRKYLPDVWAKLETIGPESNPASKVFQALPSVMTGALAGVFLTGGDFNQAWKGAVSGAVAPLFHHVLKALPGPYKGAAGTKDA